MEAFDSIFRFSGIEILPTGSKPSFLAEICSDLYLEAFDPIFGFSGVDLPSETSSKSSPHEFVLLGVIFGFSGVDVPGPGYKTRTLG